MVLRRIVRKGGKMGNGSGKTRAKIVLTHRSIGALKSAAEAYRVPDLRCAGLAIRVAPSGLKTWDCAFRIRGTATIKRKGLGTFPSISLDDARERATALTKAAQAGRDALQEEAQARKAAAARMTVGELIDEYVKLACGKLRTKHEIEIRLKRALQTVVDDPAETIHRRDLRVILNEVSDRGVLREAEKQRQSIHAMFKWAVGQDIVPINPAAGLAPYSAGSLRERVLSPVEIRTLWQWIAASDLTPDMQDSLRLQLCLGTRIPSNWKPSRSLASGSLAIVSWYLIERACFSLISALSKSPTIRCGSCWRLTAVAMISSKAAFMP